MSHTEQFDSFAEALEYFREDGYEVQKQDGRTYELVNTESLEEHGPQGALYATVWCSPESGIIYGEAY